MVTMFQAYNKCHSTYYNMSYDGHDCRIFMIDRYSRMTPRSDIMAQVSILKRVTEINNITLGYHTQSQSNTFLQSRFSHGKQFLPHDVAFSIHLSDNRFTARPLATTLVSPPRKWAPWVDISTPQSASARFFAKCPLRAVLCTFRHWTTGN